MRRSLGWVLAVCLAVGTAVTSAPEVSATPRPVPEEFVPSSTSWSSPRQGWVLGFAPCGDDRCPALVRTWDGGHTWWPWMEPDVRLPADLRRVRVHFANDRVGLVTDGTDLYVSYSWGLSWRRVAIADPGSAPVVGALADNDRALFAVVATDTGTRVLSSPLWRDDWRPVPGVALPGRAGGDVVADGEEAYVALTAVHRSHGYWTVTGDGPGRAAEPPCPVHADADLGLAGGTVYALCSQNPGMGDIDKHVERATPPGGFVDAGQAPTVGITTGFAAASPSTVAVTATGRGAAFVHRSADGGRTWQTPLVLPGALLNDLHFTDARHGVVLRATPVLDDAQLYQTRDGGATWKPLTVD